MYYLLDTRKFALYLQLLLSLHDLLREIIANTNNQVCHNSIIVKILTLIALLIFGLLNCSMGQSDLLEREKLIISLILILLPKGFILSYSASILVITLSKQAHNLLVYIRQPVVETPRQELLNYQTELVPLII